MGVFSDEDYPTIRALAEAYQKGLKELSFVAPDDEAYRAAIGYLAMKWKFQELEEEREGEAHRRALQESSDLGYGKSS